MGKKASQMMQVVYLCKTRGRINKSNGPVRYVLSLLYNYMVNPMNFDSLKFSGILRVLTA